MKVQDVIFRAIAKKITWWQAAEILGVSEKVMTRRLLSYERRGYDPRFWVRGCGKLKLKFVPLATAEKVLSLYQELYSDLDPVHFQSKLSEKHNIHVSRRWVQMALTGAGLTRSKRVPEIGSAPISTQAPKRSSKDGSRRSMI